MSDPIYSLTAFLAPAAKAQTVTGAAIAQELQRQIERDRALREQQETAPDVRLQAPAATDPGRLPVAETPCFSIREIVLKSPQPDADFAWARSAADPEDDPGVWTLKDLWQVFATNNSMHSCYGTGATGCIQVEIPMPGGPQGSPDGNAKLIEYVGGQRKGDIQVNQQNGGQQ